MTVYVGARDPESVSLTLTRAAGDDFDMSTVTSLEITVSTPYGDVPWTWTQTSATASTLTIACTFASDGSDVPRDGIYTIRGWLVSAGSRRRIRRTTVTAERY